MTADALTVPRTVSESLAPVLEITNERPQEPTGPVFSVLSHGWYGWGKPFLDSVLVLALAIPALILVVLAGLAVKLTSSGPAFYTQTRVGKNGRRFALIKLRTMRPRCEETSGPCWSGPGDKRVTRVGRFLRATHLDELPQLWNVLRGDMSLAGPRPERPEIIEAMQIDRLVPGYPERLAVKPGLAGLAQLQLPPDSDLESVRRKVACDLCYIERQGPWLDLRIQVATLLAILGIAPRRLRKVMALPGGAEEATPVPTPPVSAKPTAGWRADLADVCAVRLVPAEQIPATERTWVELRSWLRLTALPALSELASELRGQGKRARVFASAREEVSLQVWDRKSRRELDLKFRVRLVRGEPRGYARELIREGRRDFVHEHLLDADTTQLGRGEVIGFVLARYRHSVARTA